MDANAPVLLLLKATLLLAFAFVAVRLERASPASRRHGLWSLTFVALVALPLLAVMLPAINVPVPAWRGDAATIISEREPVSESLTLTTSGLTLPRSDGHEVSDAVIGRKAVRDLPELNVSRVLIALWLVGFLVATFGLVRSLLRVRQLVSSGRRLHDTLWEQAAARIATRIGLDTVPDLVVSPAVRAPMAGHLGRPIVFLPVDFMRWDADRRDVVLTHEMTHLRRRDPLRILAARVACALYWFHPLMWIAARRSTADCEQACDENVLALGVRPSTYARVLLDFAPHAPAPALSVALPIVQRHRLENRVMAILSNRVPRSSRVTSPRRALLTSLTAIAIILSLAAARPAAISAAANAEENAPAAVNDSPPATIEAPAPTPVRASESGRGAVIVMQDGSCWNAYDRAATFSGSSSTYGGRTLQRIGRIGRERVAQLSFDDLRVCMITAGFDGSEFTEPSDWVGRADRIVLETERDNDVRRLVIEQGRSTWTVNGRSAPIDDGVRAWRGTLLELLDASWEISRLRGQESSLRGEISSVLGERSSLLGEISSLRGEVSSMMGEISSLRGEHSSMRGEISSIRGHESSLRGQISSERGAISSLMSQRWERGTDRSAIDARIRRHEDAISEIEEEIERYNADGRVREVERRIDAFDVERKVAEVERRIRDFDVDRKVAEVERELGALSVDRRVRSIEGEISGLDTDRRVREINAHRDEALDRLRRLLRSR